MNEETDIDGMQAGQGQLARPTTGAHRHPQGELVGSQTSNPDLRQPAPKYDLWVGGVVERQEQLPTGPEDASDLDEAVRHFLKAVKVIEGGEGDYTGKGSITEWKTANIGHDYVGGGALLPQTFRRQATDGLIYVDTDGYCPRG